MGLRHLRWRVECRHGRKGSVHDHRRRGGREEMLTQRSVVVMTPQHVVVLTQHAIAGRQQPTTASRNKRRGRGRGGSRHGGGQGTHPCAGGHGHRQTQVVGSADGTSHIPCGRGCQRGGGEGAGLGDGLLGNGTASVLEQRAQFRASLALPSRMWDVETRLLDAIGLATTATSLMRAKKNRQ